METRFLTKKLKSKQVCVKTILFEFVINNFVEVNEFP